MQSPWGQSLLGVFKTQEEGLCDQSHETSGGGVGEESIRGEIEPWEVMRGRVLSRAWPPTPPPSLAASKDRSFCFYLHFNRFAPAAVGEQTAGRPVRGTWVRGQHSGQRWLWKWSQGDLLTAKRGHERQSEAEDSKVLSWANCRSLRARVCWERWMFGVYFVSSKKPNRCSSKRYQGSNCIQKPRQEGDLAASTLPDI